MSFIKTAWETWWLQWTWPLKIGSAIVLLIILGVTFGWVRSCLAPAKPKLNEAEIQKGEQAVKERNDAALKEILVQSDVREATIDESVGNAKAATVNAIHESRERYANMNTADLAAELEKRK